jgi:integrase
VWGVNPFGFSVEIFGLEVKAMPALNRIKTKYPGVVYVEGTCPITGKPERIYYVRYRKGEKQIEEKVGRQYADDMTPARANERRVERIRGDKPTNRERREEERQVGEIWTIARLWEEYKIRTPGLKGIVTDENRFSLHIKSTLGDKEPRELSTFDVDRLRLNMTKNHKPATVKNTLEILRRIINFGVKKQLCEGTKFTIEMPRVNNLKTEDLTTEQLASLLQAITDEPNFQAANFMKMVLFTGMRRSEVFKLQWGHIDFDRGFINIIDPKGGPDQKIPLNASARALLESHARSDSDYVFPGRGGLCRVDINKQVNRIKKKAGLPKDFRPLHGLRHVYASILASSGEVDLYTLQKLLTHKTPMMTQRYAHLRDEGLRRASNLAGDLIDQVARGSIEEKILRLVQ